MRTWLGAGLAGLSLLWSNTLSANAVDPNEIFAEGMGLERVASGFIFAEGPVWDGSRLLFSDVRKNVVHALTTNGQVTPLIQPSNWANGHTWDHTGNLVSAEHATGRVTQRAPDGSVTVLAERFEGKRLNSPNGVVASKRGDIYFTDPPFGLKPPYGPVERAAELDFAGVYQIDPAARRLVLVTKALKYPNGIVLSPDERTLYVNDSATQKIWAFPISAAGAIGSARVFADLSNSASKAVVDGMRVDEEGRLFVTAPDGIVVLGKDGRRIAVLPMPEPATDLAWGGSDRRDLYITANTGVYRTRVKTPGVGSGWRAGALRNER